MKYSYGIIEVRKHHVVGKLILEPRQRHHNDTRKNEDRDGTKAEGEDRDRDLPSRRHIGHTSTCRKGKRGGETLRNESGYRHRDALAMKMISSTRKVY